MFAQKQLRNGRCPTERRLLACLPLLLMLGASPAMAADDDSRLVPIVVTGTRTEKAADESPVRTEVVDRQEIERTHARTLKEALENVPGLQLTEIHGKSGFEVSLQGLTSDQVLVLIDGLPIAASTGSTVDLSQYLLTEVERIEVVKGASSAQYGSSAMGGVINVITRRIRPGLSGAATVDVGSYGKQNVDGDLGNQHGQFRIEGGGEQWRARITGDALDNKGFSTEPDKWTQQGDKIRRQQYGGRFEWLPSSAGRLWIDGNTYSETDEQRYQYFAPPNYVPQRKTEDITRDRFEYGGLWNFDSGVSATLKGLTERYDSESKEYSNDYLAATRVSSQRTQHVSLQFDLPAWHNQLWQFGGDYHAETLDQTANNVAELTGSAERSSREVFVQNDILFDDTWEMVIGLRAQDDSDFGGHLAPKVSLRANLLRTDSWNGALRASAGQGYRVPNLKERHYLFDHSSLGYMVLGNPNLKPESSNSFQFGGTATYRNRLTLEANLFYNRVRDLIQTDLTNYTLVNGVAMYTYKNIAAARTRGLETALKWQATDALAFNAAYTFTDTEDLDSGSDLTRRPRNMARLGADWRVLEGTELSLRGRYQSSELVDSSTRARSPAWTTFDLAINQRLGRGFSAFLGVNNLFNKQRDFSDTNDFGPIAGRFIYVGAKFNTDDIR
ncbi:MAG: TonB-dependent receptor [Rhodocyclaceae bacterium]